MGTSRVRIVFAVAIAAAIFLLPGMASAGSKAPTIKGLDPCALGSVPRYLSKQLTGSIAAEQKSFQKSLKGVAKKQRQAAGRDFANGVAAYIYGLPTVLLRDTVARYPSNTLIALGRLATPDSQAVVAPNHDTLYAVARADLAAGPLVIDAPATAGRYSVLQLMDANTNSVAYIGSRHDRDQASSTLLTPPGWQGDVPAGVRVIESPTNTVWILGRTLVDDAETERAEAQALMRQYALTPLANWLLGQHRYEVVLDRSPDSPKTPIPPGLELFDKLGTALAADPPTGEACPLKQFAKVGIGPGKTPSTTATGLRAQALLAAREAGERIIDDAYDFRASWSQARNDGWQLSPEDTARFGEDYAHRAIVATVGLAANTREEAYYPKTDVDSDGKKLRGKNDYVLKFKAGQLPPVDAFWSLTMYNKNRFLVANPINRYAVGDRTAGLNYGPDGSLKIYLTHDDPGGAKTANWLPSPDTVFSVHLRLYEPKKAAFNGKWKFPTIKRTK